MSLIIPDLPQRFGYATPSLALPINVVFTSLHLPRGELHNAAPEHKRSLERVISEQRMTKEASSPEKAILI